MADDHERIARLEWRADAIDIWRDTVDSWRGGVERDLQMIHEQKIEQQVRAQLRKEDRRLQLTWLQKAGALIVGAVALADAIKGLIG